jgi:hypothetical protein
MVDVRKVAVSLGVHVRVSVRGNNGNGEEGGRTQNAVDR